MFKSAVRSECPLEVFHKNCGQNGPILGNSCAVFLTKFMCYLAHSYKEKISKEKPESDPTNFDPQIFDQVLNESLQIYSEEDKNEHGRLVEIKGLLSKISEETKLNDFTKKAEEQFKKINGTCPSEKELDKFLEDYQYYQEWRQFFTADSDIPIRLDLLPRIRKNLADKKGILETKEDYRKLDSMLEILQNNLDDYTATTFLNTKSSIAQKTEYNQKYKNQMKSMQKLKRISSEAENGEYKYKILGREVNLLYKMDNNDLISEYFYNVNLIICDLFAKLKIKRFSDLSDQDITDKNAFAELNKYVPGYKEIFNYERLGVDYDQNEIKKNLIEIRTNSNSFGIDLAIILSILRRNSIFEIKQNEKELEKDLKLKNQFLLELKKENDITCMALLARYDSKLLESAILSIAAEKELKLTNTNKDVIIL